MRRTVQRRAAGTGDEGLTGPAGELPGLGYCQDDITSPDFTVPTTIANFGNTLAAVNAKFGQPATEFEIVLVPARGDASGRPGG